VAVEVVAPSSFVLDQVEVGLTGFGNSVNLDVALFRDAADSPGLLIASVPVSFSGNFQFVSVDFSPGYSFVTGERFWVGAIPVDDTYAAWSQDTNGITMQIASSYQSDLSSWNPASDQTTGLALRIDGIPEPSGYPMFMAILLAAFIVAWRLKGQG
jgi:hypothetical protein